MIPAPIIDMILFFVVKTLLKNVNCYATQNNTWALCIKLDNAVSLSHKSTLPSTQFPPFSTELTFYFIPILTLPCHNFFVIKQRVSNICWGSILTPERCVNGAGHRSWGTFGMRYHLNHPRKKKGFDLFSWCMFRVSEWWKFWVELSSSQTWAKGSLRVDGLRKKLFDDLLWFSLMNKQCCSILSLFWALP